MPDPAPDRRQYAVTVLVDYDNVPHAVRQDGLSDLLGRVLSPLPPEALPGGAGARCRLYGGWFEKRVLSPRARELDAEIRRAFPATLSLVATADPRPIEVEVELAHSLDIRPRRFLFHTYRRRSPPRGLASRPLPFTGCVRPGDCPLVPVHRLLEGGSCPQASCGATTRDILTLPVQKLVDTMLTADLIQFSRTAPAHLAIVSSDDDMWPGIYTALSQGATIHHVRPSPAPESEYYETATETGYHPYSL